MDIALTLANQNGSTRLNSENELWKVKFKKKTHKQKNVLSALFLRVYIIILEISEKKLTGCLTLWPLT